LKPRSVCLKPKREGGVCLKPSRLSGSETGRVPGVCLKPKKRVPETEWVCA
jgi:hypothetical protein